MKDVHDVASRDITALLFELESTQFGDRDFQKARERWNALVAGASGGHDVPGASIGKRLGALSRYIFQHEGFLISRAPHRRFTLCGTLLDGGGLCLGLTTLYVCLGREIGLPVHPLLYENHIAVTLENSDPLVHIETTWRARLMPPDLCAIRYGRPVAHHPVLNDERLLAVHVSSRAAFVLVPLGCLDDALFLLDSALELYPEYLAGHINRAVLLLKMGKKQQAHEALELAKMHGPQQAYRRRIDELHEQIHSPGTHAAISAPGDSS